MFILAITAGEGFDATRWKAVVKSGVDGFLLRERNLEARALLDAARWCRDTAPEVELWIAGRLDVALTGGCGLHAPEAYPEIPQGLLPRSRPLHDEAQFKDRATMTQLLVAPIFATPGKGAPWGVDRLHRFLDSAQAGPRLLALGGITPENASSLRHPRLDGVALIRGLWDASDPRSEATRLRDAWNG